MRIVVLDDYADAFRQLGFADQLADHSVVVFADAARETSEMIHRLAGADAVVLIQQRTPFPREVVDALPNLRLICQTGRHVAHIDVDACNARGIVISAGGAGHPGITAELTWALILAAVRDLPRQVQRLKEGHWLDGMGIGLRGKTLGVYGFGRIGSIIAEVGRAFGMNVLAWGRDNSLAKAREANFRAAESRARLFEQADVLTVHLALNTETRGIVRAEDFASMKPDSLFVNTSRAGLVQPGALEAALLAGRPGHAAVDVYEAEPIPPNSSALIGMEQALCTPHLGYSARESYSALFTAVVDHVRAFDVGKPINVANLPTPARITP